MSRYVSVMQRLGHQPWFSALGRRLVPFDRLLVRTSRGRLSLATGLGPPELLLTTTGRKSGQPRTVPLIYRRHAGGYVVVGSNWGQAHHPAWSTNLLAHPDATVTVRGQEYPVRARLADADETTRLWSSMTELWPAYNTYLARSGRQLRVFLLEPREPR